jgi:hypothetical protein
MILGLRGMALAIAIYCTLVLLVCCAVPGAAVAADTPKPDLIITLEENALLAEHWIGLHVWIENPTDQPFSDVQLQLAAPNFIELGEIVRRASGTIDRCQRGAPLIPLGTLGANAVLQPPHALCLYATSAVEERDVNLAFSLDYAVTGPPLRRGVVVVEKQLSVGLFGTDTVAGVSLRLATYLIPGLLLMAVLRFGGIEAIVNLPDTYAAAISVLVSVSMTWLAANWSGITGISARLFLILCMSALGLGVVGNVVRALLIAWRDSRQARLIGKDDSPVEALAKALHQRRDSVPPVTITTWGGESYAGALSALTQDKGTALLGWFKVDLRQGERPPECRLLLLIQSLFGPGAMHDRVERRLMYCWMRRLVDLAIANRHPPTELNLIRQKTQEGAWEGSADAGSLKRFRPDDILQISHDPVVGLDVKDPPVVT